MEDEIRLPESRLSRRAIARLISNCERTLANVEAEVQEQNFNQTVAKVRLQFLRGAIDNLREYLMS